MTGNPETCVDWLQDGLLQRPLIGSGSRLKDRETVAVNV